MPTIDTLATGLAGAIGCHMHGTSNRLYFVEYGGKLSRLDLVRSPAAMLVNATRTLKGTWLMDLDTGLMTASTPAADLWWEQIDSVRRRMVPRGGAQLAELGVMSLAQFNALGAAELQALDYSSSPITGDDNAANRLVVGTVFAVRTNGGNVAKLRVTAYGYDIKLRIVTWRLEPACRVLGTGYAEPEDVKVNAAGTLAWITERGGNLLRVPLVGTAAPNRSQATVVAGGLQAPHQISLHEDRGLAYVVEYASPGHLVRIDLATGAKANIAFGLERAIGLLITADHRHAYVTEQAASGGRLRRIRLDDGSSETLLGGLVSPFMMAFADAGESALLLAERDPANRIRLVELGARPVVSRVVAAGLPHRPSSLAVRAGSRLLVCCDTVVAATDLAASLLAGSGPLLLGVGHVPVDRISGGYADTTADPGYFFQVKDAPFGGALALQFNHVRARALGATLYKVFVDGSELRTPFTDYRWSVATSRFEATLVAPNAGGFFPVRAAGELWYNAWLGLVFDSSVLADGNHTVEFRLYRPLLTPIATPGITSSVLLRIDNSLPTATIHTISQGTVPVGNCGIVTSGPDSFRFEITAHDPQQHLLSWSLVALWGDNKSKLVAEDSYAAHVSPTRQWGGPQLALVPGSGWSAAVAGDPTSTRCAHSFVLNVWDRVINGWGYIHHASAHRSITIMLP